MRNISKRLNISMYSCYRSLLKYGWNHSLYHTVLKRKEPLMIERMDFILPFIKKRLHLQTKT